MSLSESSVHGEQVQQPVNTFVKKDCKVAAADARSLNAQAATNATQVV